MANHSKRTLLIWVGLLIFLWGCNPGCTQPPSAECADSENEKPHNSKFENDRLPIRVDGKWGFIDKAGKLVIEPQFAAIDPYANHFSEDRIAVGGKNGKWGFIDKAGNIVIEPKFDNVGTFRNKYAAIKLNNKWGFIDWHGNIVIEPQFKSVSGFIENLAGAKLDTQWGYIDRSGKFVIRPQFNNASSFFRDRARVQVSYLWGMINANGDFITKPQYSLMTSFYKGVAVASYQDKTVFINEDGKIVKELEGIDFDFEMVDFTDGLLPVWKYRTSITDLFSDGYARDRRLYGFVDITGKIVIPLKYKNVSNFENCLAAVQVNGKWGIINTKDEMLIQPEYEENPLVFLSSAEGLAIIQVNQKYGYIDQFGRIVIKPQFIYALPFSENLASVKVSKGKWGFIDRNGKFVIEPQFDKSAKFVDGIAQVEVDSKVGYIDKTGRYIWKPTK